MRYTRLYTAILLSGAMVLNICKYQLPYIEYNLFKDYIIENLCVKRYEANNDCQGKCFLDKQIDLINETDNTANNTDEKQQITFDDYIINEFILHKPFFSETHLISFVMLYVAEVNPDVPTPPPRDCWRFSLKSLESEVDSDRFSLKSLKSEQIPTVSV